MKTERGKFTLGIVPEEDEIIGISASADGSVKLLVLRPDGDSNEVTLTFLRDERVWSIAEAASGMPNLAAYERRPIQ